MQLESMIGLYYTFIHITPFNGLIFYVFRRICVLELLVLYWAI